VKYERDYRREFLERWAILNIAYAAAFWISLSLLWENPLISAMIKDEPARLVVRALFLHFFPLNVMYMLASAYCHHRPSSRWHEHRVFFLMLLIVGVLWGLFLPDEMVSH